MKAHVLTVISNPVSHGKPQRNWNSKPAVYSKTDAWMCIMGET